MHSSGQSIVELEEMIELEKHYFGSLMVELREILLISNDLIIIFFIRVPQRYITYSVTLPLLNFLRVDF